MLAKISMNFLGPIEAPPNFCYTSPMYDPNLKFKLGDPSIFWGIQFEENTLVTNAHNQSDSWLGSNLCPLCDAISALHALQSVSKVMTCVPGVVCVLCHALVSSIMIVILIMMDPNWSQLMVMIDQLKYLHNFKFP